MTVDYSSLLNNCRWFLWAAFSSSMLEQVGRMTLGGLLALGYTVVVSYKRASTSVNNDNVSLSLENIDTLGETFMVLRGMDRKVWTFSLYGVILPFISLSLLTTPPTPRKTHTQKKKRKRKEKGFIASSSHAYALLYIDSNVLRDLVIFFCLKIYFVKFLESVMWKREKFCKTLRVLFCGKAVLFVFGGEAWKLCRNASRSAFQINFWKG